MRDASNVEKLAKPFWHQSLLLYCLQYSKWNASYCNLKYGLPKLVSAVPRSALSGPPDIGGLPYEFVYEADWSVRAGVGLDGPGRATLNLTREHGSPRGWAPWLGALPKRRLSWFMYAAVLQGLLIQFGQLWASPYNGLNEPVFTTKFGHWGTCAYSLSICARALAWLDQKFLKPGIVGADRTPKHANHILSKTC